MIVTYRISGMTCNGCRAGVEEKLSKVSGVSSVKVSLEAEEALIEADTEISLPQLQSALPDKYTIIPKAAANVFAAASQEEHVSKLKQLKPLFLIFLFITGAAVFLNYREAHWQNGMLDFMGLFYVVFSFFKFLDLRGFKNSFAMYDPMAKVLPSYGWGYPFIELGLGLLFLMRWELTFALWITLIILGLTTIGVTHTLLSKKNIQCACLGTALKLPMTEATFIENAVMIVMAIAMLAKIL